MKATDKVSGVRRAWKTLNKTKQGQMSKKDRMHFCRWGGGVSCAGLMRVWTVETTVPKDRIGIHLVLGLEPEPRMLVFRWSLCFGFPRSMKCHSEAPPCEALRFIWWVPCACWIFFRKRKHCHKQLHETYQHGLHVPGPCRARNSALLNNTARRERDAEQFFMF